MRYDWNDGHMDDGWGVAMMLTMLGFWVLITVAIVFAIVWSVRSARVTPAAPTGPTTGPASVTASAEKILAERLARGEIDAEEYRSRVDALNPRSAM